MPTDHIVQQGDCLSSIAAFYKRLPKSIWDAGENAELKQKRKSSNVLRPGDKVVIPDLKTKQIDAPTDQETKFVRLGATCKRDALSHPRWRPRNQTLRRGLHPLPRWQNRHRFHRWRRRRPQTPRSHRQWRHHPHPLAAPSPSHSGALDPHDTLTGMQARLNQCGYNAGSVDGNLTDQVKSAIKIIPKRSGHDPNR